MRKNCRWLQLRSPRDVLSLGLGGGPKPILVVAFAGCLIPTLALAATRYVPTNYATIQAAIDASSSGDYIVVLPDSQNGGPYAGFRYNGKNVTVQSQAGKALTTIAGEVKFWDDEPLTATLMGFTVQGGTSPIRIGQLDSSNSRPHVEDCIITGGSSTGIKLSGSGGPALWNLEVKNCAVGIQISHTSHPSVADCEVHHNTGTGIRIENTAAPLVRRCRIHDNSSDGILGQSTATPKIDNCIVDHNGSDGIEVGNSCHGDMTNCVFAWNTRHGIALSQNSSTSVKNCVSSDNSQWGIFGFTGAVSNITYTCTYGNGSGGVGGSLTEGAGPIHLDPKFVGSRDFHLLSSSPCIDAGDPTVLDYSRPPGLGASRSDMGAYGGANNDWPLGLPDLECEVGPDPDSSEPPDPWDIGESIEFHLVVQNAGSTASAPCRVGFYVGSSPTDVSTLRGTASLPALNPGLGASVDCLVVFQAGDVGQRYLTTWIDDTFLVDELDNNNNLCSYGPFWVEDPYYDTDKLHFDTQSNEFTLYYQNANQNQSHDPGEAVSTIQQGNLVVATDESCWIATANNLVQQEGHGQEYLDWLEDGASTSPVWDLWYGWWTPPGGGEGTFDDLGFAHWPLDHDAREYCGPIHTSGPDGGTWNRDPIPWCQSRLAGGSGVGIEVWFQAALGRGAQLREGYAANEGRHVLTLWSIDPESNTLVVSDSDDGLNGARVVAYTWAGGDWALDDLWPGIDAHVVYAVASSSGLSCQPDYMVQGVWYEPAQPSNRDPITLHVVVKNVGEKLAPQSTTTVMADGLPGCAAIATDPLSLNQTREVICVVGPFGSDQGPHVISVSCCANSSGVPEATSGNNCATVDIPITLHPSDVSAEHVPSRLELETVGNHPADRLHLRYGIPEAASGSEVELVLFDAAGRRVRTLVRGMVAPGRHEIVWDGRQDAGEALPSGVYFARLSLPGRMVRKTLVLSR